MNPRARRPQCPLPGGAGLALAVLAIASATAGAASAHDFCLLPGVPAIEPGAPFDLAMHVAETFPGEIVPWRTGRIVSMSLIDAKGRTEIESPPLEGDPAQARLVLRAPGTAVVALVTDASYIELPGAEFDAYLEHDGHAAALAARRKSAHPDRPGRERYTRHVKTILNVAGPSASVAVTRAGMILEIVPETALAGLGPGGTLPVRVFYKDAPYADAPICASHEAWAGGHDTYAWCGRLDGAGRARIPITSAGWQMIRASKMIPVRDDPKADWHSYWTTLTFPVAAATPAAPESAR
ncbi:MAG TPA: DUF4198 domain-containing protein [Candidatus Polarisedimenticolia bacterium]|nr:DUF4198 domain-containing protein [Candidatus Polarisedimenticolia bacterium]